MRNLDAARRNLDESRQRRRGSFESLAQVAVPAVQTRPQKQGSFRRPAAQSKVSFDTTD
jgi:hypothetical protein